jgi:predicted  nucleic acid-binding Zn-ribbon protein
MEEFEARLESLRERLKGIKAMEGAIKQLTQRVEEIGARQHILSTQYSHVLKEGGDLSRDLAQLKSKVEKLEKMFREFLSVFEQYLKVSKTV